MNEREITYSMCTGCLNRNPDNGHCTLPDVSYVDQQGRFVDGVCPDRVEIQNNEHKAVIRVRFNNVWYSWFPSKPD